MSATLLQVGVGSGGMAVLDSLCRDRQFGRFRLVDPDCYEPNNVERHFFGADGVGQRKVDLAADWIRRFRPDAEIVVHGDDLTDPAIRDDVARWASECDVAVCAVDGEPAKYAFDEFLRTAGKPWTLGEVLSGGIAGWVHRFAPGGACYGCVASYLKREIRVDNDLPPDYTDPQGPRPEMRIPASKASIATIAGLHAMVTLDLLAGVDSGFTSLLWPFGTAGVFPEAHRPFRFTIPRSPECLICGNLQPTSGDFSNAALDEALARLGAD
jgi:molybdopterin/thiamine biosynthesis adenylyltransferase